MPRTAKGAWRHTEREVFLAVKNLRHASVQDLAAALDISTAWTENKIRILYDARRIYISDWKKQAAAGDWLRIFSVRIDDEEDAPKPAPISHAERERNRRNRNKLWKQLSLPQEQTKQLSSTMQTV